MRGSRTWKLARAVVGDSVRGGLGCDVVGIGLLVMADRTEEAEVVIDRLDRASADQPGAPLFSSQVFSESLWRLGRLDRAIEALRASKRFLDGRGETGVNSTVTGKLARYLADAGRYAEAADARRRGTRDGHPGRLRDPCRDRVGERDVLPWLGAIQERRSWRPRRRSTPLSRRTT